MGQYSTGLTWASLSGCQLDWMFYNGLTHTAGPVKRQINRLHPLKGEGEYNYRHMTIKGVNIK